MKLSNVALVVVLAFALIGMVTVSLVVHELSHWQDYEHVAYDDQIALFVIPTEGSLKEWVISGLGGSYTFKYALEDVEEVNRISKYTEIKAYSLTFLLAGLYLFVQTIVIKRWSSS